MECKYGYHRLFRAADPLASKPLPPSPKTDASGPTKGTQNLISFAGRYTADAETNQTQRACSQGGTD